MSTNLILCFQQVSSREVYLFSSNKEFHLWCDFSGCSPEVGCWIILILFSYVTDLFQPAHLCFTCEILLGVSTTFKWNIRGEIWVLTYYTLQGICLFYSVIVILFVQGFGWKHQCDFTILKSFTTDDDLLVWKKTRLTGVFNHYKKLQSEIYSFQFGTSKMETKSPWLHRNHKYHFLCLGVFRIDLGPWLIRISTCCTSNLKSANHRELSRFLQIIYLIYILSHKFIIYNRNNILQIVLSFINKG